IAILLGETGTPAATEARLEFVMRTNTGVTVPLMISWSLWVRSRNPKGFTPLKMKLAFPSQRLSKLKTALIIVGAFLGIARRTLPSVLRIPGVTVLKISFSGTDHSTGLPGEVAPAQAGRAEYHAGLKAPNTFRHTR